MSKLLSVVVCVVLLSLVAPGDARGSGEPVWEEIEQVNRPSALWEAGVSFARAGGDPGVVYRFGGQDAAFPNDFAVNDFWALELSTGTWTELTGPETPAGRADALMMPGPCGRCVSVVGGRGRFRSGEDLMFPEMWTYHVASGRWSEARPSQLGDPLAVRRSSTRLVEVPGAGQPRPQTYYAVAGVGNTLPSFPTTPTGLRNDVAVYRQTTGWELLPTFGEPPVPRGWPSTVYDPIAHALLLFGGYRLGPDQGPGTPPWELFGPTNYENDLWSLDLATSTWTRLEPAGALPRPRDNAIAFFDAARGGLVVFGGQAFDGALSDLWFYSLAENRWYEVALAPGSPLPPARVGGVYFVQETASAYELYLHGGSPSDGGSSTFFDDLWKLTWPKG